MSDLGAGGAVAAYAYHNCEFRRALTLAAALPRSSERAQLEIKAWIELDQGASAATVAARACATWPETGALHYWHGVALYIAKEAPAKIEAAFAAAEALGDATGPLGRGFLEAAAGRFAAAEAAIRTARPSGAELGHVRHLMLFQALAMAGDFAAAERELAAADRLLAQTPSLLRLHWGQLCWVRWHVMQGEFAAARALLARLAAQLSPETMPRLALNVAAAGRSIAAQSVDANVRLATPARDAAPPSAELAAFTRAIEGARARLGRKPMLNLVFARLVDAGPSGATKEALASAVWGESYNPLVHDDRIYKAVGRIRRLLADDLAAPRALRQVGRHYVLALDSSLATEAVVGAATPAVNVQGAAKTGERS